MLTLATKAKVLSADRFWADQAAAVTVKFPTASDGRGFGSGRTDLDATWIVTRAFHEKWSGHFNVGYTWTGDRGGEVNDDVLHCGVALDYQAVETLQLVGEIFSNIPFTAENDADVRVNAGLRWQATGSLVLDAALGTGVRKDRADLVATLGLTWSFDFDGSE